MTYQHLTNTKHPPLPPTLTQPHPLHLYPIIPKQDVIGITIQTPIKYDIIPVGKPNQGYYGHARRIVFVLEL
jgi:hypothetical protein